MRGQVEQKQGGHRGPPLHVSTLTHRRTGATMPNLFQFQSTVVSILTRPGGRVQQMNDSIYYLVSDVSILTRPGGRVQLV